MKKLKIFTVQHPIIFGFLLIFIYSILGTLTWPITQLSPESNLPTLGEALAKLVIALVFIVIVWQFGWLRITGVSYLGGWQIWLLLIPLIIYTTMASNFAFTGGLFFTIPRPDTAFTITLFEIGTSLVEEVMYRGLLLAAMIQAWGYSSRGLYKSASLSALSFALLHLFNLIVNPLPEVSSQVLMALFAGFIYATFVLLSKSIWPAVLCHYLVNTVVNFWLTSNPVPASFFIHYIRYTLLLIPPLIVCVFLLSRKNIQPIPLKQLHAA